MTDIQTSLPLLIVWPSILNPVINFSTRLWPVKWNVLGYTFALGIPFHLLWCWCNTCTNQSPNDMIHFISLRDRIGSSILTSLALHRCLGPLVSSHHSTCPSHLQLVRRAKSYLDLLPLVTWLNVMSHMQWAPSSSHVIALQQVKPFSPPWHMLLTHMYLWTNHLCISN
jgi:hypothetical protein